MFQRNKTFNALLLMLVSSSLVQAMQIEKKSLFIPGRLGDISVRHDQNSFHVMHDGETTAVKSWQMDKELRSISQDKLAKLLAAGAYLQVNQSGNNDYTLRLQQRINGGGAVGATIGCWLGRFAVYAGAGLIVAGATAIGGPPLAFAVGGTIAPVVEGMATAAAIGGGIVGGVATGPV
jgi:hypothetical protein